MVLPYFYVRSHVERAFWVLSDFKTRQWRAYDFIPISQVKKLKFGEEICLSHIPRKKWNLDLNLGYLFKSHKDKFGYSCIYATEQ
jgi:hypothetical protein